MTRPPNQRGDRPADPPLHPPARAPQAGQFLPGVPVHSGARAAGMRLLPCRHDLLRRLYLSVTWNQVAWR